MKRFTALLSLVAALIAGSAQATEFKTITNGNWNAGSTWNQAGSVPTMSDNVKVGYNYEVTVDTAGNFVGNMGMDGGLAILNVVSGGGLIVTNQGGYPVNGAVWFKDVAVDPIAINVDGGQFEAQGSFIMKGGREQTYNPGATNEVTKIGTNVLHLSAGSVDLGAYVEIGNVTGSSPGGVALVDIVGSTGSFRVGGNMQIKQEAVLKWTPAEDGSVTPIVSDNFKDVFIDGAIMVDMGAMKGRPSEIVLIDNNGNDALIGVFATTNLMGTSDYVVSYTGGDGNDLALSNVAPVLAESQLIAGWTRAQTFPSEKHPKENQLKVLVNKVDVTGYPNKFDRGCSDQTYGSGLFTNVADEVAFHGSTSCYAIGTNDSLRVSITNTYGSASGVKFQLDYVLADWTAPFNASPKTINMRYVEGDLGIPVGTLIESQTGTTSDLIGFDDYADMDGILTGWAASDRTLGSGQYAVFEITVSIDLFGSDGAVYVDNIGLGATLATVDFDTWIASYGVSGSPDADADYDKDGDGLVNLAEFGLGGDPTNSNDIGYVPVSGTMASAGTNYFEYVHVRRTSPGNGLTYYLEQNDDLVFGTWVNSGDYVITGIDPMGSDSNFESVTNRFSTEGKSKEFIRLIIE